MNAIINGLNAPPYYYLTEYDQEIFAIFETTNTFYKILPYHIKSITISGIGGGGGGGFGGVHDTSTSAYTINYAAPAGAGGGGSGYLVTSEKMAIEDILKLVGDDSFQSGYEYGLQIDIGTGGNGSSLANTEGADGGNGKVYIVKRNSSGVIEKSAELYKVESGKGGGSGGTINKTSITNSIHGANGGAGGHGGAGGRRGYYTSTDATNKDGSQGASSFKNTEKPYLFEDSNTGIVLGQGGGGGEGRDYGFPATGVAPASGETAYGKGGKGGDGAGKENHNSGQVAMCGSNGTSGVIGIRMHYR